MRGGKREGAGRKGYGPSKAYWLPIALESEIQTLLERYKAEYERNPQEKASFDSLRESKSTIEKLSKSKKPTPKTTKNRQPVDSNNVLYNEKLKQLRALDRNIQAKIKIKHGSLEKAAQKIVDNPNIKL